MADGFSTPVGECVAIVVDPEHERFSETGAITFHDWKEYGSVIVSFGGTGSEEFNDGLMSDDPNLPGVRILSRNDEQLAPFVEGLRAKKGELRELIGETETLQPGNAKRAKVDASATKIAFVALLDTLYITDETQ